MGSQSAAQNCLLRTSSPLLQATYTLLLFISFRKLRFECLVTVTVICAGVSALLVIFLLVVIRLRVEEREKK